MTPAVNSNPLPHIKRAAAMGVGALAGSPLGPVGAGLGAGAASLTLDSFARVPSRRPAPAGPWLSIPPPETDAQRAALKTSDQAADAAMGAAAVAVGTAIGGPAGTVAGVLVGVAICGLGGWIRGR